MTQVFQQFDAFFNLPKASSRGSVRILLMLPIVIVVTIFTLSPNYDFAQRRNSPLGGDFLQEWVGGHIVTSEQSRHLYELDYFKSVQHDESLVGFHWPYEKYYPAIYPPFYYLIVSPLAALDYRTAAIVWGILSALALIASGELAIRFFPPCRPYIGYGFLLAMLFAPLLTCLNIGHKSTFLLLILTSTFVLLYHKRFRWAGVVFGLMAFKPHLALLIGVTMLIKRQWNFVFGAAITVTFLIGLSFVAGPGLCRDYVGVVLGTGDYVQTGGYDLADAHSLWGATQNALQGQSVLMVTTLTAILSLIVVGLLASIFQGTIETNSPRFAFQFAAMVLATVLLSPHLYFYDLTVLLLPLLLVLAAKDFVPEQSRNLAVYLVALSVMILFGAGTFKTIATSTLTQPSVLLVGGLLVVLARLCQATPGWGQFVRSVAP